MGAWIEIKLILGITIADAVAPHMGAWIEIVAPKLKPKLLASHPTWVRGLKLVLLVD